MFFSYKIRYKKFLKKYCNFKFCSGEISINLVWQKNLYFFWKYLLFSEAMCGDFDDGRVTFANGNSKHVIAYFNLLSSVRAKRTIAKHLLLLWLRCLLLLMHVFLLSLLLFTRMHHWSSLDSQPKNRTAQNAFFR